MLAGPSGKTWKLVSLFSVVATLTNFLEGFSNSYPNTAGNSFEQFINNAYNSRGSPLTKWAFTWFWSFFLNIWFIGYLIGTFLTPIVCDNFGRQKSLLGAHVVSFLSTTISTLALIVELPELLFVGRLLCSIASGISFSALILFLQETAPTNLRGLASYLSECVYLLISVVGMLFGMDVMLGRKLLLLLGSAMIPSFLSILVMLPLPETPKYLLMHKKDRESAVKALKFYQGDTIDVEVLLNEMLKESLNTRMDMKMSQAVLEVFHRPFLRKAACVGILSLQLSIPIWPITYLSTELLEAHFSPKLAQASSFVFITINFVSSLTGMFFIEKVGRRPLLICLGILNTMTLISYVTFDRLTYYVNNDFRYGCVGALIAYGVTYGFALGPIAFFITSEMVPQRFRSIVQSMVFAVNTTANFLISFATLPLYKLIDIWCFFPLFIIPSSFALIYLYFQMPETRGKEVHEIVSALMPRYRIPSSTNDLVVTASRLSSKSNFTDDASSSADSDDEEQAQQLSLGDSRNFIANLCLNSNNTELSAENLKTIVDDKVLVEKL